MNIIRFGKKLKSLESNVISVLWVIYYKNNSNECFFS